MRSSVIVTALAGFWTAITTPHVKQERLSPLRCESVGPSDSKLPTTGSRLALLIEEHGDLDIAISILLAANSCDDLLLTRLKKRKLQIKDEIALCEQPKRIVQRAVRTELAMSAYHQLLIASSQWIGIGRQRCRPTSLGV
jgi:hypothetical protein